MGPLNWFLNKVDTKIEALIDKRERTRERQRSYTPSPPRNRSPDPFREERKRRQSLDDRSRKYIHPSSSELKTKVADDKKGQQGRSRNSYSEGNLADPRQSRGIFIKARDRERGRNASPQKSHSVLARAKGNNRPHSRSDSRRKRHHIALVPASPPQWTEEARQNAPSALRPNNRPGQQRVAAPVTVLPAQEYERLQREAAAGKAQKQPQPVDWDEITREKNEPERFAAQKNAQKLPVDLERVKREKMEIERLAAETQKRHDAKTAAAPARRLEENQKKQEERKEEARRQREWEKAERRKKVEEAERKAKAERIKSESDRRESVKRENEAKRLKAFGTPGGRLGGRGPQRRALAWPYGSPNANGPQETPLRRRDAYPAAQRPVAGSNGQQENRNDSARDRQAQPKPTRPAPVPLTAENLRAQQDHFKDLAPVSELNRPFGDMARTFLDGMVLQTVFESDVGEESEDEDERNR